MYDSLNHNMIERERERKRGSDRFKKDLKKTNIQVLSAFIICSN